MLLAALTSAILMVSSNQQLHQYLFWTVGGLDYRRWEHVWLVAMPVLPAIIAILILARHLNILVLGDMEARALGMKLNSKWTFTPGIRLDENSKFGYHKSPKAALNYKAGENTDFFAS